MMRKNRIIGFRSWVLLLLIIILAFLMLYFLNKLQSVDLFIKKNQITQQAKVQDIESRVKTLEEVVVLQNQLIVKLEDQQPSPVISQKEPDPKEMKEKVESDPHFWPVAVVGVLQVLKGLVNPVKVLLPY